MSKPSYVIRSTPTAHAAVSATSYFSAARRVTGLALALPPAVVALYLAKSALGIDLLPGPSPLHDILYHLVR